MEYIQMGQRDSQTTSSKSSEQFWIGVIEDSVALGWPDNAVPVTSFSRETAETVAEKLNMTLLVRGPDYVFRCKKAE